MKRAFYELFSRLLLKKHVHLIRGLTYLGRPTVIPLTRLDYVRVATLELLATEIMERQVPGSVAELGVYKGGFAKYISAAFKDRSFYLFDTFDGFAQEDIRREKEEGLAPANQDFSDTSVKEVLGIVPFPAKCIIRKGIFPDTFRGLEQEAFSFVSIDADLYEPIRQGLELFYPNLSRGGYIMVHDYNNHLYKGCKKAVREFCAAHRIACTPLPDIGGSMVIQKP